MIDAQAIKQEQLEVMSEKKRNYMADKSREEVLSEYERLEKKFRSKETREELEEELYWNGVQVLEDEFGVGTELEIPVKICGRIKNTGGTFRFRKSETIGNGGTRIIHDVEPVVIKIALTTVITSIMLEDYDYLFGILKHEVAHYILAEQGKPFGENDKEFIELINKWNAPYAGQNFRKHKYHECDKGCDFVRLNQIPKKYRCRKHKLPIHYKHDIIR